MEVKLEDLFNECIEELAKIGINFDSQIDIKISKRNNKRYGCCKYEQPILETAYRNKRNIYYKSYNKYHIEISRWVLDLNKEIIKNTIMHELVHCIPSCNNHGKEFKKYANIINNKLGYNITRLGNKREDFEKSNIKYDDDKSYKYKIICTNCGMIYYRNRISKKFLRIYRCSKCKGKLKFI